jgi:hypothetical protein
VGRAAAEVVGLNPLVVLDAHEVYPWCDFYWERKFINNHGSILLYPTGSRRMKWLVGVLYENS